MAKKETLVRMLKSRDYHVIVIGTGDDVAQKKYKGKLSAFEQARKDIGCDYIEMHRFPYNVFIGGYPVGKNLVILLDEDAKMRARKPKVNWIATDILGQQVRGRAVVVPASAIK